MKESYFPVLCRIIDELNSCLLFFDHNGNLIKSNKKADFFLAQYIPEHLILTLEDLEHIFKLEPMDADISKNSNEVFIKNSFLKIERTVFPMLDQKVTLVTILDNTGQRKQMTTMQKQTTDLLWKIRSRITPVHNAITLLLQYSTDLEKDMQTNLLENSRIELYQLERYMDNFRDLSMINGNLFQQSLSMNTVVLNELVLKALHTVEQHTIIPKKNFSITNHVDKECCITGDRTRIIRIIESLFFNSIVYSDNPVEIVVSSMVTPDVISLKVADNGFGIAESEKPNIFSYGFRGTNTVKTEYSGLGCELFLGRNMLLYMNAALSFESKEGNGTTFEIQFYRN